MHIDICAKTSLVSELQNRVKRNYKNGKNRDGLGVRWGSGGEVMWQFNYNRGKGNRWKQLGKFWRCYRQMFMYAYGCLYDNEYR